MDINSDLKAAARRGQAKKVQALLEAGADVDATDEKGLTVLTVATQAGHTEIGELLKKAGAVE